MRSYSNIQVIVGIDVNMGDLPVVENGIIMYCKQYLPVVVRKGAVLISRRCSFTHVFSNASFNTRMSLVRTSQEGNRISASNLPVDGQSTECFNERLLLDQVTQIDRAHII